MRGENQEEEEVIDLKREREEEDICKYSIGTSNLCGDRRRLRNGR
jgi:hypothetical protein